MARGADSCDCGEPHTLCKPQTGQQNGGRLASTGRAGADCKIKVPIWHIYAHIAIGAEGQLVEARRPAHVS